MDSKKRTDERRRIYWMALGRGVLCAFAAGIVRLSLEPSAAVERVLPYAVIAAAFVANLASLPLTRTRLPARVLAAGQIALDVVFITALVYSTGGANSEFLLLYFGPLLAAAVAFSRTATILVASLSTMGLFACAAAYGIAGASPPLVSGVWLTRQRTSVPELASILALQAAALHLVAFLASTLALRARRANIETEQILDNMSDGVITVARDGRVVFANSRARGILSIASGTMLVGMPLGEIAPGGVCDSFRQVVESGRPDTLEAEMGANRVPAQVVVFPVSDHTGGVRGANVILHDITERKKLIEALRRADRLEATAMTAASIAHEIRNPVAAIRGSAQELKRVTGASGADGVLLDLVVRESDRLNRVLTEFLNFARMPKPQMAEFDARELLDEVAAQVEVSIPGSSPEVRIEGPRELLLRGDSEQLRQVFVNVGLNAVEATGGKGPVAFRIEAVPGGVAISASDRGTGIDEAIREKIFEPFFTTKTTGTGLGLSVAKRIVEDHGGSIEAGVGEDGCTRVKVFLPAAGAKREAETGRGAVEAAGGRMVY